MMRWLATLLLCLAAAPALARDDDTLHDSFLQRIVRVMDLRPLPTKPFEVTEKFKLGRALFFDPILSGNRDVSCATCHLLAHGTSDGLPLSIGTGGVGLGAARKLPPGRAQQPRNALDLWNRDNNSVKSMFWDGRVEVLDPARKLFRSPLGDRLPKGFENVMAVQSLVPIAREDEMLGQAGDRAPHDLPTPHAGQANDIAAQSAHLGGADKIASVLTLVLERLVGGAGPSQPWHATYRALFRAAYPSVDAADLSIAHMGNALSHFEEIAFATREAPWDAFLKGAHAAIGAEAKRGAFVFFGKGRCGVCHIGPLFSDFEFHSIGVPASNANGDPGPRDLGRYAVTGRPQDKYKFRTPPLRNATLTAPYFHDGSAATVEDAIRQHLDPLRHADKYQESGAFMMDREEIDAISPVLVPPPALSDEDVAALMAFLRTLEDRAQLNIQEIVPATVPSGLPVLYAVAGRGKAQ